MITDQSPVIIRSWMTS